VGIYCFVEHPSNAEFPASHFMMQGYPDLYCCN